VTVIGLLQAHDVDLWELTEACERIANKNDDKTLATHEYANGKIRRKSG
jgi:hypothetical protein